MNDQKHDGSEEQSGRPDYGVGYRAADVPARVAEELRAAAAAAGMTLKGAVTFLLPPAGGMANGDRLVWLERLAKAIHAGQRVALEYLDEETEVVSVHLPPEYRDALRDAAQVMGTNTGAAGRLILLGAAAGEGGILGVLTPEPAPISEGEVEAEEALAGAGG
jgi:hypothetical protein